MIASRHHAKTAVLVRMVSRGTHANVRPVLLATPVRPTSMTAPRIHVVAVSASTARIASPATAPLASPVICARRKSTNAKAIRVSLGVDARIVSTVTYASVDRAHLVRIVRSTSTNATAILVETEQDVSMVSTGKFEKKKTYVVHLVNSLSFKTLQLFRNCYG